MLLEEPSIPIRDRRGDVPPALAEVIEKCLARDPKDRYPGCDLDAPGTRSRSAESVVSGQQ